MSIRICTDFAPSSSLTVVSCVSHDVYLMTVKSFHEQSRSAQAPSISRHASSGAGGAGGGGSSRGLDSQLDLSKYDVLLSRVHG